MLLNKMGKHFHDEIEEEEEEEEKDKEDKNDDKDEARPYSKNLQGQFFRTRCNCGPLHARCQHNNPVHFKSVFASSIQEKRLIRNDNAPSSSLPTPTPKRRRIENDNLEKVKRVSESQERQEKLVSVQVMQKEQPLTTSEDAACKQHIGKWEKFDEHETRENEEFININNNSVDQCVNANIKVEHYEYEPSVEKLIKKEVHIEAESVADGYQIWEDNEDENPLTFPDEFELPESLDQIQEEGEAEICQMNWNFIDDILHGMTVDDMIELDYILS